MVDGARPFEPKKKEPPPAPPAQDDVPLAITPLGRAGGRFYFFTPAGELQALTRRDFTGAGLLALFDGKADWLEAAHPEIGKKGRVDGFRVLDSAGDLMRRCAAAGFFDPTRHLRGPGAWRGNEGLIVHCGDKLLIPRGRGFVWKRAGLRLDGHVYPAAPGEVKPGKTAATPEDAQAVLEFLASWYWMAPNEAPRILLGWLGQAMIAGAFGWRTHLWVTGDSGSGKTVLATFVDRLLGDMILYASDSTEAGIRQALSGAARPVVLDEVEPAPGVYRARDLVRLARLAASDGQGPMLRGSADGTVHRYPVRACFYFSSILHPDWLPQDAGRICVLDLGEIPAKKDGTVDVHAELEALGALGPALRRRMIEGWPRLQANLGTYHRALSALARSARQADQFAGLLACAETLLSDAAADPETAAQQLRALDLGSVADAAPDKEGDLCLAHLMSGSSDVHEMGRRRTIGELVEAALHNNDGGTSRGHLLACGLKLVRLDGAGGYIAWIGGSPSEAHLAVANRHQALNRLFADTRWADGVWGQALARLPRACRSGKTMSFAGAKQRAVVLTAWLEGDFEGEAQRPPDIDGGEG